MSLVSEQMVELTTEFSSLRERLRELIDNRSLWADGIEGCRAALEMLNQASAKLKAVTDAALQIDTDLDTARSEITTWSTLHAELSVVEKQLRAELTRKTAEAQASKETLSSLKKSHAKLVAAEKEVRSECERHRTVREQQESEIRGLRADCKQYLAERDKQADGLAAVEAELSKLKKEHEALLLVEQELRTECAELRTVRAQQKIALANAKHLAKQLINEAVS